MSKKEDKQTNNKTDGGAKIADNKDDKGKDDYKGAPLSESDIALFKRYGKGPYAEVIKKADDDIKDFNQKITALSGIKESDTGLALPAQWNLQQDMMMLK